MILTVDTSTRAFSLSLYQNGELAHMELHQELAHSQQIVAVLEFILARIGSEVDQISAAYAGLGPGSFTGVRIGLSFVNTLAQLFKIPLLGVSSLDLLAFAHGRCYNSVVSLLRSRKNEVYAAVYEQGERKSDYLILKRDEFKTFLSHYSPEIIVSPEEAFHELEESELEGDSAQELPRVTFAYPASKSLYYLAEERGLTPEPGYLKPIYVRGI